MARPDRSALTGKRAVDQADDILEQVVFVGEP